MGQQRYRYKPSVLEQLEQHGILPRPDTDPALVREFLYDLYVIEIRRLKQQQVALEREQGPQARRGYADRVIALRRKYPLLSVPLEEWIEGSPAG